MYTFSGLRVCFTTAQVGGVCVGVHTSVQRRMMEMKERGPTGAVGGLDGCESHCAPCGFTEDMVPQSGFTEQGGDSRGEPGQITGAISTTTQPSLHDRHHRQVSPTTSAERDSKDAKQGVGWCWGQ